MKSNLRNEIKSYIVRSGYTMQEVVDRLSEDYGWSDSVSNLSNKLQRESLRYVEAVQLADALGYDLVWQKRRDIYHRGFRDRREHLAQEDTRPFAFQTKGLKTAGKHLKSSSRIRSYPRGRELEPLRLHQKERHNKILPA